MNDVLIGENYEVSLSCAILFTARGLVVEHGGWAFNVNGDEWCQRIEQTPISPTIQYCLDIDKRNGDLDRIAQLYLAPKSAVLFYLEGGLRFDHFKNAREEGGCILIPPIEVCGWLLPVVITSDMKNDVSTADAKGRLI